MVMTVLWLHCFFGFVAVYQLLAAISTVSCSYVL